MRTKIVLSILLALTLPLFAFATPCDEGYCDTNTVLISGIVIDAYSERWLDFAIITADADIVPRSASTGIFKDTIRTDSDGRFELLIAEEDIRTIHVSAHGYADNTIVIEKTSNTIIDLGKISLHPVIDFSIASDTTIRYDLQEGIHTIVSTTEYIRNHGIIGKLKTGTDITTILYDKEGKKYTSPSYHIPPGVLHQNIFLEFKEGLFKWTLSGEETRTIQCPKQCICDDKNIIQCSREEQIPQAIRLHKGWNTIAYRAIEETPPSSITQILVYDTLNKEFFEVYPQRDEQKISRFRKTRFDKGLSTERGQEASWVYVEKETTLFFNTYTPYKTTAQALPGLTLIEVIPPMIGKTLDEIRGPCTLSKAYTFNSEQQEWEVLQGSLTKEQTWRGLLIKTDKSCTFTIQ